MITHAEVIAGILERSYAPTPVQESFLCKIWDHMVNEYTSQGVQLPRNAATLTEHLINHVTVDPKYNNYFPGGWQKYKQAFTDFVRSEL